MKLPVFTQNGFQRDAHWLAVSTYQSLKPYPSVFVDLIVISRGVNAEKSPFDSNDSKQLQNTYGKFINGPRDSKMFPNQIISGASER